MNPTASLSTIQIGKEWFPEKPGGLDRYYFELVRHLPAAGVAVNGLVIGSDQITTDTAGTIRSFAPSGASLMTRWRGVRNHLGRALSDDPASLVVTHFALYAAPCVDLLRNAAFVVHFQGPWSDESRAEGASALVAGVKRRLEHSVYRRAGRFIVLSHAFRRVLEKNHAVPAERVDVIPGGVDCARWQPQVSRDEARRMLGWPLDRPIVFVVRRLVRRMGLETLIESVAHLRRIVPDALIVIAGKGPLAADLDRRAREAGVADHVKIIGFVPDDELPTAYRAADLTIVPSIALEGFGLVVVESLAAGTPVLVTNIGGLPETISGLAPQCVITDATPGGLARAIGDALLGKTKLPDAAACIAHAKACFDWSSVANRVAGSYRAAVQ
jgi:glycosyltransferase involved in cell wall biosynthesis